MDQTQPDPAALAATIRNAHMRNLDTARLVDAVKALIHGWDHQVVVGGLAIAVAHLCDMTGLPRSAFVEILDGVPSVVPPPVKPDPVALTAKATADLARRVEALRPQRRRR